MGNSCNFIVTKQHLDDAKYSPSLRVQLAKVQGMHLPIWCSLWLHCLEVAILWLPDYDNRPCVALCEGQ